MIKVELNNQQEIIDIDEELKNMFKKIAEKAAQIEGYKEGTVSVAFVDNQKMKELNKKYRQVDSPTDVLSFPMDKEIWGDVIISTEKAVEQAKKYGHTLKRELGFLYVHGILHLLGYDHYSPEEKKEMRSKEEKILQELDLTRD